MTSLHLFQKRYPQRGFIALISTVIISTILLGLALTIGGSGVFARLDVLNSEYKRISLGLAESCSNVALLRIAQNYGYTGNESGIVIGTDGQGRTETCDIGSVSYKAPNHLTTVQDTAVITTKAEYPSPNGANSTVTISATVQNPAYAVPPKGSLTVVVNVVDDDGGTKQSSDFTLNVSGTNAFPNTFSGAGGTGVLVEMDAGAYAVSVSNPDPNYNATASSGCSGNMSAGASQTCTITENDIATTASLTVIAQVLNDNGGTLLPSDFPLFLDGTPVASGVPVAGLLPGLHTASASPAPAGYTASLWGTDCANDGTITLVAGNKKTCTIIFDDNAPPAPVCVDTVMMLDRTGSMNSTDLSDERTAADGLLNLYAALSSPPKSAVGVFGAIGASEPYNAAIMQSLTTTYSSLLNAVSTGLANSGGYTNLASAISTAQAEFTSHGTPGKGHVLILLSDGGANRPTGAVASDTGWTTPTASAQNAVGDSWSTPAGAYGAGDASDAAGHRERYSALGLNVPAGATVTGIEVQPTAWSSGGVAGVPANLTLGAPFGTGNYNQWSSSFFFTSVTSAVATNDGDTTYITASSNGQVETYAMPGAGLSTGSTINSVTLTVIARGTSAGASIKLRAEKGTGAGSQNDGPSQSLSTTYAAYSQTWTTNPFTGAAWTLAEANNWSTNFGVVRTNASGGTPRVTQAYLVVNYTPPPPSCTLGVDLSYNAGLNWTSEKPQALSAIGTLYTLGATNDTWGRLTWAPTDFSDANFRIRIHDTNPGPTCHVDALQARVSYTTPVDPYEAALDAADAAKLAGTQIFTIHYGDPGSANHDINFLANLANGSTAVAGHQSGSANDLSDTPASGNTGYISPSTNIKDTGGDGNGFESNPSAAYADGSPFASNIDGPGDRHRYSGYNFNLPANAVVSGIVVRPDWWLDSTLGTNSVSIELSWDGGVHWTSAKTEGTETTFDTNSKTVGSSADTWGHAWAAADLTSSNFIVRISSNSTVSTRDFYLDWLPVQIYYTGAVPENGDGDNFYVSPTSANMQGIFTAIGQKVCPALTAPPPPPPPTTGTLIVLTHVVNNNGGTNSASDFTMSVSGTNPSQSSFAGSESPGVIVTLDPGAFSADQNASALLYSKNVGAQCSGTIHAGDVLTCTITDDDIPPPPPGALTAPPPPSDVNIGTWGESP